MKKKFITVAMAAVFITGCASIVSDKSYPVTLNSTPSSARFEITNDKGIRLHGGRTPTTVMLKSGNGYFSSAEYTVIFKKNGYEDKYFAIESSLDGWYWGNILFGGLIGFLIIDPITGAMWKLPEHSQHVSLDEIKSFSDSGRGLKIVSLEDIPYSERDSLVRLKTNDDVEFESNIRSLLLGFGSEIRYELSIDINGDAVSTLIKMINAHSDQRADTDIIKTIAGSTQNELQFANKLIGYYGKKN